MAVPHRQICKGLSPDSSRTVYHATYVMTQVCRYPDRIACDTQIRAQHTFGDRVGHRQAERESKATWALPYVR
jgi:hypothetical protein